MKYLICLLCILFVGCGNSVDPNKVSSRSFAIVCLKGVEYYMRAVGNYGYLAVKIDKDTLQPVRCDE